MYLLTWSSESSEVIAAFAEAIETYQATVRTDTHVELFERRGNDWIRIRPEAANAE